MFWTPITFNIHNIKVKRALQVKCVKKHFLLFICLLPAWTIHIVIILLLLLHDRFSYLHTLNCIETAMLMYWDNLWTLLSDLGNCADWTSISSRTPIYLLFLLSFFKRYSKNLNASQYNFPDLWQDLGDNVAKALKFLGDPRDPWQYIFSRLLGALGKEQCFVLKINKSNMVMPGVSHGENSWNLLLGSWRWDCVALSVPTNGG